MTSNLIFLIIMALGYNYLIFELIDTFLENSKQTKIQRVIVCVLNTLAIFTFAILTKSTSVFIYIFIGAILLVEFFAFYKDKFSRCLFCMLACLVHIIAIRSICVAIFAIIFNMTAYEVISDPVLLVFSTAIVFMLLNIAVILVNNLIPPKNVKIINQHKVQLNFMTSWLAVFCGYLLVCSSIYRSSAIFQSILFNQIISPIVVLSGTYIVLLYSFKTSSLLGYKFKTEELQSKIEKERQYRKTFDKDVFRIIEINFSKNQLISGFEDYEEKLGDIIHDYGKMLAFMIENNVHPEDRDEFLKYISPKTVIAKFMQGTKDIFFDYRRLMPDGVYVWMRVYMAIMLDDDGGDVTGFVQIKNIDAEKIQQLELKHMAESDSLTDLYNKSTTEKLIDEYLSSENSSKTTGVLFVIDVDNFKIINDRLGHLYGDAVLSELSENLQTLFRNNDIVGRIGGDEFLVFAKGLVSHEMIEEKANKIRKTFFRTYSNELNLGYTVSCSIGISVFPKDGTTFEELFKCADAALYLTKSKGKNGYSFYTNNLKMTYISNRTEIDTHGNVQKSFRDNRIEYVFRLLYGSDDTKAAIESVLELIAINFRFSRANIFEFNENSTHFSGIFEWCADGIESVIDNYIDLPLSSFDFVISSLEQSGGMFAAVPSDFPVQSQDHYNEIGIKSIVHYSINEGDKLIGVIAFQNCVFDYFVIPDTELEELRVICQVLSVFMAKQLTNLYVQRHFKAIQSVMDNMNSIAYVIDRETYEVLYENQNVTKITGHPSIGNKCYFSYRGLDKPCDDCALAHLSADKQNITLELYTEKFDLYTQTSAALIDWSNNKQALLISSVDITEYKKQEFAREQRGRDGINENFDKQINELLGRTKIGAWDWDLRTDKVIYSEAWAETLGYKKHELIQNVGTWEGMVLPEDLTYAHQQIDKCLNGETDLYEAEFRMICKNGSIIWAQDKGHISEVDENGKPVRFVGVLQNVSRIKDAEMQLKQNQETLDLAVNVAELGTWDWDITSNRIKYNNEYLNMLGLTQNDVDGSMEEWQNSNHPDDLENTITALNDYISGKTETYECEIRMKHKDGHYIWTKDIGRIVSRDENGKATRLIGGHLNIDALKRSQEQLNALAYHDPLTGLSNMVKFKIDAKKILEQNLTKPFVFTKIDIANFKMVNDFFGSEIGDLVLKKVCDTIKLVKEKHGLNIGSLARVHDDVFIMIDEAFDHTSDEITLRSKLFEKLFNAEIKSIIGNYHIKFTYGRYFPQIGETDVEDAIECVTLALSKAKLNTSKSSFDYDINVKKEIRREVEITNKMQHALDNNEFVVFLQGKRKLEDECLCGAECLARWIPADGKIIFPSDFIPLFEKNGFITKLDMFMFKQCCAILADWKKRGNTLIPISVNFSRKHLGNPNFAHDIAKIAKQYDVEPKYLEIELTETIVMDPAYDLTGFISSLHMYGFKMSIDDFGAGYSSLGMLKSHNFDTIKLDRSFFMDTQENAKAQYVLSNMLHLAMDLGIKTVAEGVEEKHHVNLLRKLNCDIVQGYYFGKPMPLNEFMQAAENLVVSNN